jgi:hypothetical protein
MPELRESRAGGVALLSIAAVAIGAGLALHLLGHPSGANALLTVIALAVGLVLASLGLARLPVSTGAVSFGEKSAWLSLVAALIAAVYVVYTFVSSDGTPVDPGDLAGKVIAILALAEILAQRLRRHERGVVIDERDLDVRRRAVGISHVALLAALAVAALILSSPLSRWLSVTTTTGVVRGIILALVLSELARHAAASWLYRAARA